MQIALLIANTILALLNLYIFLTLAKWVRATTQALIAISSGMTALNELQDTLAREMRRINE